MAWLRERVAQILQVNPWLAGRLKKDKAHGIHLAYPLKPADIDTVVVQIEDDIGLRMGIGDVISRLFKEGARWAQRIDPPNRIAAD